ncbi:MAG: hypothetical protein ACK5AS_02010 [Bacteroidota bacterium]
MKTVAWRDVVHKMITRLENTSFTTLQQTPFGYLNCGEYFHIQTLPLTAQDEIQMINTYSWTF